MSNAPAIIARNVMKTYRLGRVDVPVLRGIDLDVGSGELLGVLGASGSGKSTLLHILGALDRADRAPGSSAGTSVRVNGVDLVGLSSRASNRIRREQIGFVFQFYHLMPELTVTENVAIAAMIHGGQSRAAGARRAATLLDRVGLSHRLSHRPVELSGGERQRVAIARALVNDPPILLADEPTGNLDRVTGNSVLELLMSFHEGGRRTTIIVTHDPEVASRVDRVVRLADGKVAPEAVSGASWAT